MQFIKPDTNIDFIGKAITVASNFLIDADTLHIENTIINGSQPTDPDFGSCVRFTSNEDTTSVIIGFTLTEGSGCFVQSLNANVGGGIYCDSSSPKIVFNYVMNSSSLIGGGVGINNCSPILLNNVISYNTVTFKGGGVNIFFGSNPYLEGNIISNNTAISVGGVLFQACSPTFVNNIICNNTAETYIGGLDVLHSPGTDRTTIENCQIYGNTAGNSSGGLQVWNANVDVINCTISDNHAGTYSGGVGIFSNSTVNLSYTSITGNSASTFGGGIHIYSSEQTVTNCTIYGNEASYGGGISNQSNSNSNLVNCILWNDSPEEIYISTGSVTATYSDIQGGEAGIVINNTGSVYWLEGNIDSDPLFVDSGTGNFHLQPISPCIDAGTHLTETTGSGSGTVIEVEDAGYFTDGFGLSYGDLIQVGDNNPVRITGIDYDNNEITVEQSISWNSGDGVSFVYAGLSPDIGAYEYVEY